MLDFIVTVATAIAANSIFKEKKAKPYQMPQSIKDFYEKVTDEQLEFVVNRERVEDHPEYYAWAKEIAIRLLGLSQEKADEKFKVGKHLPIREYPLSYIDEVMLYHGKLSSKLAYGGFEVPSEVYGLKFTQERWDRVVNLAYGINEILKEHGVDEKLVLHFKPYRNREEFRSKKIPILFYLDDIDFDFVLDLYMNYGQVGKTIGKIDWEAQNSVVPKHRGETMDNAI